MHHYKDSYSPGNCISSSISLQVHSGNFNFSELEQFWQRNTPKNVHIKTYPEKHRDLGWTLLWEKQIKTKEIKDKHFEKNLKEEEDEE